MARRGMTSRQAIFVTEYLVDLNATQAAIRAGYSPKTAAWTGPRLLAKAHVAEAVEKAMAARAQRTEITADLVVAELAKIAFADPRDLMEWGPEGVTLKESALLTADQAAGVAEVAEGSGRTVRLKKHDKVKALELLGRHIGMFKEKVELSGGVDVDLLEEARRRVTGR